MLGTACEWKKIHGRTSSSVNDTVSRGGVKRRATSTWCPWSTDSDDDEKTTSNSTSGSTYATATDATRKRLIGGTADNG